MTNTKENIRLISHRGNLYGPKPKKENSISYITHALSLGFDVEVDFWMHDENFLLGHDYPEYKINFNFIEKWSKKLWIHCKNMEALCFLSGYNSINYFWHEKDSATLTSHGYIWAYPGKQPIKNSIAVMPEIYNDDTSQCFGLCSDYIGNLS
jgi:hypothetical protein